MSDIHFIDVTLRDAHQSLWSTRMTTAMMTPILSTIDRAGLHTLNVAGGAVFEVCVRYLDENPWERIRIVAEHLPNTPVDVMTRGQSLYTFELFSDDVVELNMRTLAASGVRHVTPYDALNDNRNVEISIKAAHAAGLETTGVIAYTSSPVHTDAYFAARAAELVALRVGRIMIKDSCGLLTPGRITTLVPAIQTAAPGLAIELHSHCLSALAPQVYIDAMKAGVRFFHTASSPLANGASLPAMEEVRDAATNLGLTTQLNETAVREMADYFTWLAARENKPLGKIACYDESIYEHQIPGGMITNLRTQLRAAGIENRLPEILLEVAQVRKDLGYPLMVSPFGQFLVTQATLNVIQGERYKTVPDEIRKYALGFYGRVPAPMSPAFLDRAISDEQPFTGRPGENIAPMLPRIRAQRGPFRNDGDLLLATFFDDALIQKLARPRDRISAYRFRTTPLMELIDYLTKRNDLHHVHVSLNGLDLTVVH